MAGNELFYYNDQANLVNFAHPGLVMSKLFLERRKHKSLMRLVGLFLPKAKINSFTIIKALIMESNKRYIITPNFLNFMVEVKRKLNKKYFKEENMIEIDIHEGHPKVDTAIKNLEVQIKLFKRQNKKAICVITGYGSSGGSHKIKNATIEYLEMQKVN